MGMYKKDKYTRVREGDIFRDIEYIEDTFLTEDNQIGISVLMFPYVVVLSQDCDLESDMRARLNQPPLQCEGADKKAVSTDTVIESILISPAYDKNLFMAGDHLRGMNLGSMQTWKTKDTRWPILVGNRDPRYHFLPADTTLAFNDMVIDFKHYYTIPRSKLYQEYEEKFIGTLCELYRENLSQRFANYLSRIGTPI
jgi:hypothetical protein